MLHELLLALVGCTGDVFMDVKEQAVALGLSTPKKTRPGAVDENDGETDSDASETIVDECTFRVAPDITFLKDSEREVLDRLLHLGFYYKELDNFCGRCRNLSWINLKQQPGLSFVQQSVYCRALANGIAEVLAVYRSAVLQVEQTLMADPVPVLAAVTQGLHQFEVLLAPLYALIREVEREQLRGGRLLNLLHAKCHCGIPELQACMQRLLWHGHQVMYRQLSTWMVYGLLQDQHQEFFVRRQQPAEGLVDGDQATEEARLADWHSGFCVNLEMLPEYISLQVAESILFVGKALRVLRNPSLTFKSHVSGSQRGSAKGFNRADDSTAKYSVPPIGGYQGPELLPPAEADSIASMLRDLKKAPDFHKLTFERAVDSIRTIAAIHLWKLVVVHADLIGHLKALKDYFLLAKGDFFQCFLEESRNLMRIPPRLSTAEADLKVPFQQAAIKTIGDDDKYFNRVSLRMPTPTSGSNEADIKRTRSVTDGPGFGESVPYDGWDGLALEYSIDWPLQLLFTKDVLAKYTKVFQYLLRLKRIQLELEKSWAQAMQQDRADTADQRRDGHQQRRESRQLRMPMWRVRQHMTYLITNLQFYIQVDVIESQWNLLQERVEASKDFTELARFHQEYLAALISQSFLDIGSVSRILDSIINLCLQLCRVIEQEDGTPNFAELERITEV
ncbi:hypothetical protein M758_2G041200 [Ceratodon purpureus]|nr:hypothetical protein M758_2G041200 [Ceratodon purpureus]